MGEVRAERSPVKLSLQVLVALLVSAGTLWWAFHDADLNGVWGSLKRSSPAALLTYFLANVLMHIVRTFRWGLVLRPLGNPGAKAIFTSISVGVPASFFIPLRLGEFVRPAIIARHGIPFAGAVAAVAVTRIVDGLVNVGLFFLFLGIIPGAMSERLGQLSKIALVFFGVGGLVLVATFFAKGPMIGFFEKVLTPLGETIKNKLLSLLTSFIDGVSALGSARRLALFLLLTALFWGINGVGTWILASSYIDSLPLIAGPFTSTVLVFAVTIPAGPAFAGTMEAGFRLALLPFGVQPSAILAVALAAHTIHLIVMSLIGGVGLMLSGPSSGAVISSPSKPVQRR